ncbi:MAG: hypothetical protein GWN58_49380, partial [Anaerolineae bacterium]|nr:hypothetical protein [Anaerolineae bacterium]
LPEGARVQLYGVNQTGRSCYIEGDTVQGRQVEGWAACNRLLFHEPTAVPTPGNE